MRRLSVSPVPNLGKTTEFNSLNTNSNYLSLDFLLQHLIFIEIQYPQTVKKVRGNTLVVCQDLLDRALCLQHTSYPYRNPRFLLLFLKQFASYSERFLLTLLNQLFGNSLVLFLQTIKQQPKFYIVEFQGPNYIFSEESNAFL